MRKYIISLILVLSLGEAIAPAFAGSTCGTCEYTDQYGRKHTGCCH
jgi:hypothetical protein